MFGRRTTELRFQEILILILLILVSLDSLEAPGRRVWAPGRMQTAPSPASGPAAGAAPPTPRGTLMGTRQLTKSITWRTIWGRCGCHRSCHPASKSRRATKRRGTRTWGEELGGALKADDTPLRVQAEEAAPQILQPRDLPCSRNAPTTMPCVLILDEGNSQMSSKILPETTGCLNPGDAAGAQASYASQVCMLTSDVCGPPSRLLTPRRGCW